MSNRTSSCRDSGALLLAFAALGFAFLSFVVACSTPASAPIDAAAIGPSLRRTVAENRTYVTSIAHEILPLLEAAIERHPEDEDLVLIHGRLLLINGVEEDRIGRGELLLLVLDRAENGKD